MNKSEESVNLDESIEAIFNAFTHEFEIIEQEVETSLANYIQEHVKKT
jgi:hypothetical protein